MNVFRSISAVLGFLISLLTSSGNSVSMTYTDGAGRKLSVEYSQTTHSVVLGAMPDDDDYTVTSVRRYVGPHIFTDGKLEYSGFENGYFDPAQGVMYYAADWQGNNIGVYTAEGRRTRNIIYYPYGEPTIEPVGERFLFGGKERERGGGRNSYDFGARILSSGAWTTPDPLAERFYPLSPYIYCSADPINHIDPDGRRERPVDYPYKPADYPKDAVKAKHSNDFGKYRGGNHPHGGVDINIGQADFDLGAPVYATHEGTIVRIVSSEDGNGGGIRISIKSPGGEIKTSYMHLNNVEAGLELGQKVSEGQRIGYIGNTGRSRGPHLHYEIEMLNKNGKLEKIDPAAGPEGLKDAQKLVDNTIFRAEGLHNIDVIGQKLGKNKEIRLDIALKPIQELVLTH